ncbi:MAG: nicotinate-nucleotide adenylyltransferase [Blastocatellia bacterium]|nr:nicotinate-nucleotide adenylyltransferase [Blastocatellia bacterium]
MIGKRIGVYGGTFDPIHNGHLRVADEVVRAFDLDRMLMAPAVVPPHKRKQAISSPFHRLAMLALATRDRPRLFVSTIELEAPERPYTIETLGRLQTEFSDARLFFLMGADSFRDIPLWREHERILTEYDCIVAMRPGVSAEKTGAGVAAHLARRVQERVVDLRPGRRPTPEMLATPRIYLTDYVAMDVSSTELRESVARGEGIHQFVPAPVADYIEKYCLYQNS